MTTITQPTPTAYGTAVINALGGVQLYANPGSLFPPSVCGAAGDSTCVACLYDSAGPLALSSLAWASNVVTATTSSPHGLTTGAQYQVGIVGAAPSGYNGNFLATITGASTFTYPLTTNPGTETTPGSYVTGLFQYYPLIGIGLSTQVFPFKNGIYCVMSGVTPGSLSVYWN